MAAADAGAAGQAPDCQVGPLCAGLAALRQARPEAVEHLVKAGAELLLAARALLDGAIAYARKNGATLLEAYPVDKPGRSRDDYMWFGAKSMYDAAGFTEVARRKPERPVVRQEIGRPATD